MKLIVAGQLQKVKKKKRISCLIPLGITVVVILILASIAVPDFLKYNHRGGVKQSEAKTNLGAVFASQTAYFGEHGTYAGGGNCFELIGWGPESLETKYSYYCGKHKLPCTHPRCQKSPCLDFQPPAEMRSSISPNGFTITAVGNIDRDDFCDVWTMNDAKALKNWRNDMAN